ncbi:MAG: hypothetical protein KDA72_05860 [Planctomycetales bacterium]|nr:hypothetical protein [Planctomycetales bacterium]
MSFRSNSGRLMWPDAPPSDLHFQCGPTLRRRSICNCGPTLRRRYFFVNVARRSAVGSPTTSSQDKLTTWTVVFQLARPEWLSLASIRWDFHLL